MSSPLDRKVIPSGKTINGYQIVYIIGVGGFGGIYKVKEKKTNQMFALKTESLDQKKGTLPNEIECIKQLKEDFFPKYRDSGISKKYKVNYIVMNLLGASIGAIQAYHHNNLDKSIVYNICYNMLGIIKAFHSYGFIHCDIKPSNFLIQQNRESPLVLIDFGLCRKHIDPSTNEPFPYRKNVVFFGTKKFASIHIHEGRSHGRRDDIISWFYSFLDLISGSLPWENLKDNNEIINSKKNLNLAELGDFPPQIEEIYNYISQLKYEDEPDYVHIAKLFKQAMEKEGVHLGDFDWFSFYAAHSNLANLQKAMSLNMIKVINEKNHEKESLKSVKKSSSTPVKNSGKSTKNLNENGKSRIHRRHHHKNRYDQSQTDPSLPPIPDKNLNDNEKDNDDKKKSEKSEQAQQYKKKQHDIKMKKKKDSQIYESEENREKNLEEEELSDGRRCLVQ